MGINWPLFCISYNFSWFLGKIEAFYNIWWDKKPSLKKKRFFANNYSKKLYQSRTKLYHITIISILYRNYIDIISKLYRNYIEIISQWWHMVNITVLWQLITIILKIIRIIFWSHLHIAVLMFFLSPSSSFYSTTFSSYSPLPPLLPLPPLPPHTVSLPLFFFYRMNTYEYFIFVLYPCHYCVTKTCSSRKL